jgi:hypothetical protein
MLDEEGSVWQSGSWKMEKGGCELTNAIIEPFFCRIEQ